MSRSREPKRWTVVSSQKQGSFESDSCCELRPDGCQLTGPAASAVGSSDDLVDHASMDIGQAAIDAVVADR